MGINVFARKSRIDESVCNEDEAGCDDTGVPLSDNTGRPEAKTSSVQLSGSRSGWELGGGIFGQALVIYLEQKMPPSLVINALCLISPCLPSLF